MLLPLPSTFSNNSNYFCLINRENVTEAIEKINTFIATRTTISRNTFTVADVAMWAAIKGTFLIHFFTI